MKRLFGIHGAGWDSSFRAVGRDEGHVGYGHAMARVEEAQHSPDNANPNPSPAVTSSWAAGGLLLLLGPTLRARIFATTDAVVAVIDEGVWEFDSWYQSSACPGTFWNRHAGLRSADPCVAVLSRPEGQQFGDAVRRRRRVSCWSSEGRMMTSHSSTDKPWFDDPKVVGVDYAKDRLAPFWDHIIDLNPGWAWESTNRLGPLDNADGRPVEFVGPANKTFFGRVGLAVTSAGALLSLSQAIHPDSDGLTRTKAVLDLAELSLTHAAKWAAAEALEIEGGAAFASLAGVLATAGGIVGGASLVAGQFLLLGAPYQYMAEQGKLSGTAMGSQLGVAAAVAGLTKEMFRNEILSPFLPVSVGDTFEQERRRALVRSADFEFWRVRLYPKVAIEAYELCLMADVVDHGKRYQLQQDLGDGGTWAGLVLTLASACERAHQVCRAVAQEVAEEAGQAEHAAWLAAQREEELAAVARDEAAGTPEPANWVQVAPTINVAREAEYKPVVLVDDPPAPADPITQQPQQSVADDDQAQQCAAGDDQDASPADQANTPAEPGEDTPADLAPGDPAPGAPAPGDPAPGDPAPGDPTPGGAVGDTPDKPDDDADGGAAPGPVPGAGALGAPVGAGPAAQLRSAENSADGGTCQLADDIGNAGAPGDDPADQLSLLADDIGDVEPADDGADTSNQPEFVPPPPPPPHPPPPPRPPAVAR